MFVLTKDMTLIQIVNVTKPSYIYIYIKDI